MADKKDVKEGIKAPEVAVAAEEKKGKTNSERNREHKEAAKKACEVITKYLKDTGKWDGLPAEGKKYLEDTAAYVPGQTSAPILERVFGGKDNIKVGATVTLLEAMTRTLKGQYVLDATFKKMAEKGIVIEKKENADAVKSTYTIKSLPQG